MQMRSGPVSLSPGLCFHYVPGVHPSPARLLGVAHTLPPRGWGWGGPGWGDPDTPLCLGTALRMSEGRERSPREAPEEEQVEEAESGGRA